MNYENILTNLREENNLTQEQVASALNIKRSSYKQFEKQYDIIPINRLNDLANLFNVSIDYILGLSSTNNYKISNKELDKIIIKNRLKEFRKDNNLTQTKLANILKVGNGTIGDYERGARIISTPILYTICSKYHISADYLLGKTDNHKYLK